ncbi:M20 family metallopeptidase [Maritalea mediterranea]|uniref:M20/M25/M40 family metallo-hydrolase n=1 Tax=Maritalea mediterranea TaxID=2909667 RepID=A0ABS9EA66_9HYPH|nr:M20/M25/M40 family metallo-hydrolase [Maritalea mediterranea]MCF4099737.1 M20/M25/M40 family metallo-hydrolase [Maritalea mediterranea]
MAEHRTDIGALLDEITAVELLRGAVARESITGNEANFVGYLDEQMAARKLSPVQEEFLPGRPNIFGKRHGSGGGQNLLFIGHTDTVHVDGWRAHWQGDDREDPFGGAIVDGEIWGRGTGDLKAGICTSLAALDLLDKAGIKLKGDVSYAFIGDEESGEEGTGISAGIHHLTQSQKFLNAHQPDFAVYVEPTQLQVFPAQMGFFIADITIKGKTAYFGVPEQGIDALKASHQVMQEIWALSDQMGKSARHDLVGEAFILITKIEGGGYIAVPGECEMSLICKVLPGQSLDDAVAALETAIQGGIAGTGCQYEISYPAGRDHEFGGSPTDIDRSNPAIDQLAQALSRAMPDRGVINGAPYWSEAPFLIDRLGCPTVYCAPGNIANCHTLEERVSIKEYLAGITAFAEFIMRYCGVGE